MQLKFILATAVAATTASAHYTKTAGGGYTCDERASVAYCPHIDSASIIRCKDGQGVQESCAETLKGLAPAGAKHEARCLETNKDAGDAACKYQGLIYGRDEAKAHFINGEEIITEAARLNKRLDSTSTSTSTTTGTSTLTRTSTSISTATMTRGSSTTTTNSTTAAPTNGSSVTTRPVPYPSTDAAMTVGAEFLGVVGAAGAAMLVLMAL